MKDLVNPIGSRAVSAAHGYALAMTEQQTTIWYHKTGIADFELKPNLHLGTIAQANMRAVGVGSNVVKLTLVRPNLKLMRKRDKGDWRESYLRRWARKGYDGIIYLNRYEGIPLAEFDAARSKYGDIDNLDDAAFRKVLPSALDSLIIFDPALVRFHLTLTAR